MVQFLVSFLVLQSSVEEIAGCFTLIESWNEISNNVAF